MTTSATPAAAPAAPVAPVADPAAPAAPATPPAAPPAAPAAPAADPIQSILPADPGAAPAAPATPPAAPADPNAPQPATPAEWFLSDGVKGEGVPPPWYKADKYKSVAAQAEAYSHLEKRLGAFTGAPKDGKYEFAMPEGVTGEFDTEHPMYKTLVQTAAEMQISQDGFNKLMGLFAQYEAGLAPDPAANLAAAREALGETADARITAVGQWVMTNLGAEQYQAFRRATNAEEMSGEQIARVIGLVEAAVNKGRVKAPKPGDDVPTSVQNAQQEVELLRKQVGPDGKLLYFTDPKHRALVDKKRVELQKAQGAA